MFENLVPLPVVVQWWQRPDVLASWIAAVAGLLTLVCVLYQLRLERRQTRLAEEQTRLAREQITLAKRQSEIIEKQDEILARSPKLILDVDVRPLLLVPGETFEVKRVVLSIFNDGTKTAQNYHWHIWIPASIWFEFFPAKGKEESDYDEGTSRMTDDKMEYRHFSEYVALPLYPQRGRDAFRLQVGKDQQFMIRWQVSTENGLHPDGAPGKLPIFEALQNRSKS